MKNPGVKWFKCGEQGHYATDWEANGNNSKKTAQLKNGGNGHSYNAQDTQRAKYKSQYPARKFDQVQDDNIDLYDEDYEQRIPYEEQPNEEKVGKKRKFYPKNKSSAPYKKQQGGKQPWKPRAWIKPAEKEEETECLRCGQSDHPSKSCPTYQLNIGADDAQSGTTQKRFIPYQKPTPEDYKNQWRKKLNKPDEEDSKKWKPKLTKPTKKKEEAEEEDLDLDSQIAALQSKKRPLNKKKPKNSKTEEEEDEDPRWPIQESSKKRNKSPPKSPKKQKSQVDRKIKSPTQETAQKSSKTPRQETKQLPQKRGRPRKKTPQQAAEEDDRQSDISQMYSEQPEEEEDWAPTLHKPKKNLPKPPQEKKTRKKPVSKIVKPTPPPSLAEEEDEGSFDIPLTKPDQAHKNGRGAKVQKPKKNITPKNTNQKTARKQPLSKIVKPPPMPSRAEEAYKEQLQTDAPNDDDSDMMCFRCGDFGHWENICPYMADLD